MIVLKKPISGQQLMKEMMTGMFGGLMGQFYPLYLLK
jgi:hypothetical protein